MEASPESLPLEALRQLDEICSRFEAAWRSGQRPLIEHYLDGAVEPLRSELLRELLAADVERRQGLGERPAVADYVSRFPDQAEAIRNILGLPAIAADANISQTAPLCESLSSASETPAPNTASGAAPSVAREAAHAAGSFGTIVGPASPLSRPLGFLSPPQSPDEMGRLGGYRILRRLGEGGMGMVFEAEDLKLERRVALKVMKPEIASKEEHRLRFLRERRTAAKVEHDHICSIFQVGEENGVPFIAMPYLKGEPLDVRLKRHKPLPIGEAVRIAREIALGLAAAHGAGLVHRDIKPGNVWLEEMKGTDSGAAVLPGRVKILDFGLARLASDDVNLTGAGAIIGTPAYMAPEQGRGLAVDHRADLFSLGVMLYEMTTGRRPFTGSDTMAILTSLAVDEPLAPNQLNPAIPAELSDLIRQLLSKAPERRPPDAKLVSEALLAILMHTSRPILEMLPDPLGPLPAIAVDDTSVDPWCAIDESNPAEALTQPAGHVTSTRAAAPVRNRSSRWIGLAVCASLLLIGGGVAVYLLITQNRDGTLVVEVDRNADSRFASADVKVYDRDNNLKYTLNSSERRKQIRPGSYRVQVVGAEGIKLDSDTIEMPKDGNVALHVTVDLPPIVTKTLPKPLPPKDHDRCIAEWALANGGEVDAKVKLASPTKSPLTYTNATDLPRAPFEVVAIRLQSVSNVDESLAADFKDLKALTCLVLKKPLITDRDLALFKDCKDLTVLILEEASILDGGLACFKGCKNLTELDLSGTKVTDAGLENFKDCKNLTRLDLSGTKVTNAGLENFKDCKNLTHLFLSGTKISDAGLVWLKDCKSLIQLHLNSTMASDTGLAWFKDCRKLIHLRLGHTKITDAGLGNFKNCSKLIDLDLEYTQISDAGLTHFDRYDRLLQLRLGGTNVTDLGLASLKGCSGLVHLNLSGTKVTDAGLAYFKSWTKLDSLYLNDTRVTDAGMTHLTVCRKLTILDLQRSKVDSVGIDELRKALPQCTINWNKGVVKPKQ